MSCSSNTTTNFKAELQNVRVVSKLLNAISFSEIAYVKISSRGLKIIIEVMRSVQVSAYIPSEVFNNYELRTEDDIHFKISLKLLTVFLNLFDDEANPTLRLIYKQRGDPLFLFLNNDGDIETVECKLMTMDEEESLDFYLALECRDNNVIVKAPLMSQIFHELNSSAERLELFLGPEPPYIRFTTEGVFGEDHYEVSPESDLIEVFRCTKKVQLTYKLSYLKLLERVMGLSSRVSISTGEQADGLLSLQMIIETPASDSSAVCYKLFVEYYCTALLDD